MKGEVVQVEEKRTKNPAAIQNILRLYPEVDMLFSASKPASPI
jgi:hypothetical protein